jgi:hypothetical protein
LTARADYLILPKAFAHKNQELLQVYLQTVLFVEVVSGNKTEQESVWQLLTTLKVSVHGFICAWVSKLGVLPHFLTPTYPSPPQAVSVHIAKRVRLYGVVVDKQFTTARLVKYHEHGCYQDSIFHPSKLQQVCSLLISTTP